MMSEFINNLIYKFFFTSFQCNIYSEEKQIINLTVPWQPNLIVLNSNCVSTRGKLSISQLVFNIDNDYVNDFICTKHIHNEW